MSLPATVRRDFDNDPMQFIAFAENPENLDKMREWKLAPPKPLAPAPQEVRIVPDPEPPVAKITSSIRPPGRSIGPDTLCRGPCTFTTLM